jgi:hypothetical protein
MNPQQFDYDFIVIESSLARFHLAVSYKSTVPELKVTIQNWHDPRFHNILNICLISLVKHE